MIAARVRKLRRMGPGEVWWRLRQLGLVRWQGWLHDLGRIASCPRLVEPGVPGSVRPELLLPRGAAREKLVRWVRRERPEYVARLVREADALCAHRFVLLGTEVRYARDVAWCADPLSGRPWPMVFHSRVPIFSGDTGSGDCKYVWELNRHQFLPTLGKAYWLTGEPRYAAAAAGLVRSWIEQNPYRVGINWASGLEVAVRALAWSWTYAFFHDSAAFDPEVRWMMLGSIDQHGRFVEQHLSRYFSPYNHLVGELTALFVLGTIFPFLARARRWRATGWRGLVSTLPSQFHPDGGSVEQSTAYHHFTLGFYVQALLVRRALGDPVPDDAARRLERAFEFSLCLTRPDGTLPMIGDADEARAVDLGQPSLWDFRPYLAVGAVLFGRGDMKRVSERFPEEGVWLLGLDGVHEYERLEAVDPPWTSRLLPGSGYAVMRTGWGPDAHYLLMDCGPLAAGVARGDVPSAAHGHADALSIEVSGYGEPVLVDPGFVTYNGDADRHRYFRETAAHNTAVVDDRSQAEFRGRLTWSHAPRTGVRTWMASEAIEFVEAWHDGYERLRPPVRHTRSVTFLKPDYWLVRDEFTGTGTHRLDRYFHFAPGAVAEQPDNGLVVVRRPSGRGVALIAFEREGVEAALVCGGPAPWEGWVGVGYDKMVSAPVLCYRTVRSLPAALHVFVVPVEAGSDGPSLDVVGSDPPGRALVARLGARRDVILFGPVEDLAAASTRWTTDARVAVVRLDARGTIRACALIGGSALRVGGAVLLEAAAAVPFAALDRETRGVVVRLPEPVEISTSFPVLRVIVAGNPSPMSRP